MHLLFKQYSAGHEKNDNCVGLKPALRLVYSSAHIDLVIILG